MTLYFANFVPFLALLQYLLFDRKDLNYIARNWCIRVLFSKFNSNESLLTFYQNRYCSVEFSADCATITWKLITKRYTIFVSYCMRIYPYQIWHYNGGPNKFNGKSLALKPHLSMIHLENVHSEKLWQLHQFSIEKKWRNFRDNLHHTWNLVST